jgi:NADH-quinone oxidoreductase subunit G
MPRIIIDEREIEVPEGTKVIEAAEKLGIMIPRFCYHPALGPVGACRVCAVKFLQGPFKGVQMSCMIDARDGMVVSTTDPEAVDFRKYIIELLMLHHPHDCPVCDEGGHCLLQDMTESAGHGRRRYKGKKRTYRDQYLGPLVQHEMNRCIHCYRCSRYYQEFSGYRDLGVMQIANRTYFGRSHDGILESPFSGNLIDICPTGVYTDKPSRYFGRRWDYERHPSICIHCSLGCRLIASARYRQIARQEADFNEDVNRHFICDRGRYGFFYADLPDRPRNARVEGKEIPLQQAIAEAAGRLKRIQEESGAGAIACLGSGRSSLETMAVQKHLCRLRGWIGPVFRTDPIQEKAVQSAVSRLEPRLSASLEEIAKADFLLVVGVDPVNEVPMLAVAMRQAWRKGGKVAVIDPRPVELPFEFDHLPLPAQWMGPLLKVLIRSAINRDTAAGMGASASEFFDSLGENGAPAAPIAGIASRLKAGERPIVVCGTEMADESTIAIASDFVLLLQAEGRKAGLFCVLPDANGFGAALISSSGETLVQIVEGIEKGRIRAILAVESDPFLYYPDRNRLEKAFDRLDLLVVLDYLNSIAAVRSHIFLPSETIYEAGGIYVNQEGRAQAASRVYRGGYPIAQTAEESHPPRVFLAEVPGGMPEPAWRLLLDLRSRIEEGKEFKNTETEEVRRLLTEAHPAFAALHVPGAFPAGGIRLPAGEKSEIFSERFKVDMDETPDPGENGAFEAIFVDRTFGTEELSSLSPCLQELEGEPFVHMNSRDAQNLDLHDGQIAEIYSDTGSLEVPVRLKDDMAGGQLFIPRLRRLPWQVLGTGPIGIRPKQ